MELRQILDSSIGHQFYKIIQGGSQKTNILIYAFGASRFYCSLIELAQQRKITIN